MNPSLRPSRGARLAAAFAATLFAASCSDGPATTDELVPIDTGDAGGGGFDAPADDAVVPDTGGDTTRPPDAPPADAPDTAEDVPGDPTPPPCLPDSCLIDELCYANGAPNPENPCESCQVAATREAWTPNDAATCDDGDLCTDGDTCADGVCAGTPRDCTAGGCAVGACNADTGACESTAVNEGGACSDGDPCTRGDTCTAGACIATGASISCDDGNPCTGDTCDLDGGCLHVPLDDGAACENGDPCSVGDVCQAGACAAGSERLGCDDGNLCTLDRCEPGVGCANVSIATYCVDDNPCTDETCDPDQGCVYPFNTDPCDDGSVCTDADTCVEGACRGAAVPVDDGNPCTDDSCVEDVGVTNTNNVDACDDLNACTVGDVCTEGGCVAGTTPLDCDDDNVCTDEVCDAALGCVRTNNAGSCDDNDACTIDDTCAGGACAGTTRSCDDGNDCTVDSCDADTGCVHTLIVSNACRPEITVTHPPRAATVVDDGGTLNVRGRVSSGAGPITSFTMNGVEVPLVDGEFSTTFDPVGGGNVLVFEAVDSFDSERKRVQSFLWAPSYRTPSVTTLNEGAIDPGLGYWLGQPTLNLLASVFNLVIANYDLGALLPDPVLSQSGHTVRPRNPNPVSFGSPTTTLTSRSGSIGMRVVIPNLVARMRISGWACSGNVDYTATSLTITSDIFMRVNADRSLTTELRNTNATIAGGNINFSCFLGGIISALIGDVDSTFEDQIEGALGGAFGPALSDAFGAFALDFEVPLPSPSGGDPVVVRLFSDWNSADWVAGGGRLRLRAAAAPRSVATPYTNLGAGARGRCGEGSQQLVIPGTSPLEVVLSDDLVNQLLHGAWRGGLLELPIPESMLAGVDLSSYGITDLTLFASGMLQPHAADCGRAPGDGLGLMIGDLRIDADFRLFGIPLSMVVYVSMKAGLELTAASDGIGISLTDVEQVDLEVNVLDEDYLSFEPVIEQLLLDNLVPSLTGLLGGDALGSFPLPEIDLSAAIDGLPPGTVIRIVPSGVIRADGNSVVQGELVR